MSAVRFAKYQGIGNDFVMVADPQDRLRLAPEWVRRVCDRRFGVGADGVIRVAPGGDGAELFMDYLNSDGSVGEMCGNGIRCLALFALAEGLTESTRLAVGTRSGTKIVEVLPDHRVRVDMGAPIFEPASIPVVWDGADALHAKLELETEVIEAACLSMGNPHAVLFVDDPGSAPVTTLGPAIEHHEAFPRKTNVEFVAVRSSSEVEMRVWERGSGETMACGTGACAAAVAARALAGTEARMVVRLPGGELEIEWAGTVTDTAPVLMTGPAHKSFEGELDEASS